MKWKSVRAIGQLQDASSTGAVHFQYIIAGDTSGILRSISALSLMMPRRYVGGKAPSPLLSDFLKCFSPCLIDCLPHITENIKASGISCLQGAFTMPLWCHQHATMVQGRERSQKGNSNSIVLLGGKVERECEVGRCKRRVRGSSLQTVANEDQCTE